MRSLSALGILLLSSLCMDAVLSDSKNPIRVFPPNLFMNMVVNAKYSQDKTGVNMNYFFSMAVDTEKNQLAMMIHQHNKDLGHGWALFDFNTATIYTSDLTKGNCNTFPLKNDEYEFLNIQINWNPLLFLYSQQLQYTGRMSRPQDIFNFLTNLNPLHSQVDSTDGIPADRWRVTFSISDVNPWIKNNPKYDRTMQFDFYWSQNTSNWITSQPWPQNSFPLETKVTIFPPSSSHNLKPTVVDMIYSFATPDSGDPSFFEVPEYIYCPAKSGSQKNLPQTSPQYTFEAEVALSANNTLFSESGKNGFIWNTKQYFDTARKLSVMEFMEPSIIPNERTFKIYTIVDHENGVAYQHIPTMKCTHSTILMANSDLNNIVDLAKVQLKSPNNFFDERKIYSYVGRRPCRGAVCNVYTGQRFDWPPVMKSVIPKSWNVTTIWEYYFTDKNWFSDDAIGNIPVSLTLTVKLRSCVRVCIKTIDHITYNIINYDSAPEGMTYAFAPFHQCLKSWGTKRQAYILNFDASCGSIFALQQDKSHKTLENKLYDALFTYGKLKQRLRVSIASIHTKNNTSPEVRFYLYDKWEVMWSNNTWNNSYFPESSDINSAWSNSISKNNFIITLSPDGVKQSCYATGLKAVDSFYDTSPPAKTISQGQAAGLGIGMILLGMVLGALSLYCVAKKFSGGGSGNNFQFQMFSNKNYEEQHPTRINPPDLNGTPVADPTAPNVAPRQLKEMEATNHHYEEAK